MGKSHLTRSEIAQKEYYNRIAEEYDRHFANVNALKYRYTVYDQAFKNVNLRGASVLDAMCGGGEATAYFLRHGSTVTGLDISEACCRIYSQRYAKQNCKVVCSSILRTDFPDSCFDIVLTDSLHHLHPQVDQAMKEIFRILKPNGYFCCWEPSAGSFIDLFRRAWYRLDKKYFMNNERAIDVHRLEKSHQNRFELIKKTFGGNLAYLFVNCSMAFRINEKLVKFYAPAFIAIEGFLNRFQTRFVSCWALCLLRKRGVSRSS